MKEFFALKGTKVTELYIDQGGKIPGEGTDRWNKNHESVIKTWGSVLMLSEIFGISLESLHDTPFFYLNSLESFIRNCSTRFTEKTDALYKKYENYIQALLELIKIQCMEGQVRLPVEIRNIEELIYQTICMSEQLTKKSANAIWKNLIFNIQTDNAGSFNFGNYFFIDINGILLGITSFISEQYLSTAILNNTITRNLTDRNSENRALEEATAQLFEYHDFKTKSGYSIKHKGQHIGDIDVVAFKDNMLFFIELKTTHLRASLKEIYDNRKNTLEKGVKQLKTCISFFEKHPEQFQKLLSALRVEISASSVKIHPILVSTSFENDHQLIEGIRKISLFELQIILKNKYYFLKSAFLLSNNNSYKLLQKSEKELQEELNKDIRYFYDKKISSNRLIEIIEKDLCWNFIESYVNHNNITESGEILHIPIDDLAKKQFTEQQDIFKKGNIAFNEKQYEKALNYYQKAIDLCDQCADYWKGVGNAKAMLGDKWGALLAFDRAIKINPDFAQAYSDRGATYYEISDYIKALCDFQKALQIAPFEGTHYFRIGATLHQMGDFAQTRKYLEIAIESLPENHPDKLAAMEILQRLWQ